MILRKAYAGDIEFIFSLRNEETVRQASFDSDYIDKETHRKWFSGKITSDDCAIFIAEVDSIPVGQVRFDVVDEEIAEANIAISEDFRGKGYGTEALREASLLFFTDFPKIQAVYAYIKMGNNNSIKSFVNAGYCHDGLGVVKGEYTCVKMVLHRIK